MYAFSCPTIFLSHSIAAWFGPAIQFPTVLASATCPSGLFTTAACGASRSMSSWKPLLRWLPSVEAMVAAPSQPCSRLMSPCAAWSFEADSWNSTQVAGRVVPRWTRPLKEAGRETKVVAEGRTVVAFSGWVKFAPAVPLPFLCFEFFCQEICIRYVLAGGF